MQDDPIIFDYSETFFEEFEQNKTQIKAILKGLLSGGSDNDLSAFPVQKIKKNPALANDYNFQANIFKKNLNRSQIFDLSASRVVVTEDRMEKSGQMIENEAQIIQETVEILRKQNSGENDFFTANEFNTVERKKINGFDSSYAFENNTNNISKLESSFAYKSIDKPSENSFMQQREDFDSFFKELTTKAPKDPEDTVQFREKSAEELKDIKQQMKSLESNLNSILEKLNQQIKNSRESSGNLFKETNQQNNNLTSESPLKLKAQTMSNDDNKHLSNNSEAKSLQPSNSSRNPLKITCTASMSTSKLITTPTRTKNQEILNINSASYGNNNISEQSKTHLKTKESSRTPIQMTEEEELSDSKLFKQSRGSAKPPIHVKNDPSNNGNSSVLNKKVLVVQKRKNGLQATESPLKTRVNRETHSLSNNVSNFCKNILEEAKVMRTVGDKREKELDDFSALNRFKRYEEEQNVEVSHFDMQNHLDIITKDVMKVGEDFHEMGLMYKGNFTESSQNIRKGSDMVRSTNMMGNGKKIDKRSEFFFKVK